MTQTADLPWRPRAEHAAMSEYNNHSGMAALTICEGLLLALNDHKRLPENEIMGVLRAPLRPT